jgi:hypothetical protein
MSNYLKTESHQLLDILPHFVYFLEVSGNFVGSDREMVGHHFGMTFVEMRKMVG